MQREALSVSLRSALLPQCAGDRAGHLLTAGDNPQTFILCVMYIYVVGVPAKVLMILFLQSTLSATWLLCLLNDSEVSRCTLDVLY